RLDRPHELDDDVDVVARHQYLDVVGEQLDGHTAVRRAPADTDPPQFQRRADPGGQGGGALVDDAHHLASYIAQSQHRDTDRLSAGTHGHLTSKLKRSSTVSRRRISRARPSRTTTTAGRPTRLYRLDIVVP